MKVNKYLPFAFVYFFFNTVALPHGLTFTALLAPFFYGWVMLVRKQEVLLPFLALLAPFLILHVSVVGVEESSYFLSLLNLVLVYIFCQAAYTFFLQCRDPERIFYRVIQVNFFLCLLAIPFYFTPWFSFFWDEQDITNGVGRLRRLRLFTYEPSYYAFLFIPFFFFFLLQYFFAQNKVRGIYLLPMIILPLLLSFSLGVMASVLLACLFTGLVYFGRLARKRRVAWFVGGTGGVMVFVLAFLLLFFRHNAIFIRIANILAGKDTSGNGRTVDAFVIGLKIAREKSEYWGIGLGQIKLVGDDIIRKYYLYNMDLVVTIPNATAETLAIFGWAGVGLRMLIEFFFFFYTRVWTNYYRLLLFFFVFIYQFTGSFITNAAEYVIWIMAFTNCFRQFDVPVAQARVRPLLRSTF